MVVGYSFPEEVLEHVFSFINCNKDRNFVSLVCKSWYEIERWCRRRIFFGNCYALSPRVLIRRFPEVGSLELKGKPHFADYNLVPEGWGGCIYPWIVAMVNSSSPSLTPPRSDSRETAVATASASTIGSPTPPSPLSGICLNRHRPPELKKIT